MLFFYLSMCIADFLYNNWVTKYQQWLIRLAPCQGLLRNQAAVWLVSEDHFEPEKSSTWSPGSTVDTVSYPLFTFQVLAPVPLSIFRSNSKFDENSKHSSVKYTRPITTIFCTRHDSVTVVTCAKYRCDRSNIYETRAFWIFIEFRIRSKYA